MTTPEILSAEAVREIAAGIDYAYETATLHKGQDAAQITIALACAPSLATSHEALRAALEAERAVSARLRAAADRLAAAAEVAFTGGVDESKPSGIGKLGRMLDAYYAALTPASPSTAPGARGEEVGA